MTENTWWTRGATLVERLTSRDSGGNAAVHGAVGAASEHVTGRPDVPASEHVTGRPDDRGSARADEIDALVTGWRADHGSAEAFGERLSDLGVDEAGLREVLACPPRELAARLGRPSWAATAERAWAAAPEQAPAPAPGVSWQAGFAAVLDPFAANAAVDLVAAAERAGAGEVADLAAVRRLFTAQLAARLVAQARRTLVLEVNVARVQGRLAGATPELRFADFVRRSASRDGLRALLTGYPVLARLLAQEAELAVEAWSQALTRLVADRAAVVADILDGVDPGLLTDVVFGSGDRHQRGRTVAVLTFADGRRVVLKPRPVTVHAHFNDAARWLGARLPGLDPRTLRVLDRPGYGWVEFVRARPCADIAQVGRFYWRVGALLALVHALGGTDLHVENLIACGDQPVPVDLETLLHPVLARPATGDPAGVALAESVRRTALLPSFLVGEHGAVDVSGLGGDADATLPGEVPGWDAPATDEMRLIRTTGVFRGADNRPRLEGADADPGAYTEDLIAGFRAGYEAIAAHRDDLTGERGLLARFAGDTTRAVVRNTRWYATLLDESTHPALLRDAVRRDRLFDAVWREGRNDPVLRALVSAELAELWTGDVPLVACRPGSPDVVVGGRVISGLIERPGLPDALRRLAAMGGIDRHDQEWIIRASLATRRGAEPPTAEGTPCPAAGGPCEPSDLAGAAATFGPFAGYPPFGGDAPVAADPERLLAAACAVADRVIATAHDGADRVNWLGVEPLDDRVWAVLPQGAGLPHGYLGTALFLAELGDLTGIGRYSSLARRSLTPLPALLSAFAARPADLATLGAGFAGLGGIAYALARLAALLDDPEIRAWAARTVELAAVSAESAAAAGVPPGVMDGDAGCLAAMLAVRQTTGSARALAVAHGCADRLADRAPGTLPAGGFDTGASGVGWALLRYAAETGGSPRHEAAGLALLGGERARHAAASVGVGWCDGPSGTALALADLAGAYRAAGGEAGGGEAAADPCRGGDAGVDCHPRDDTDPASYGAAGARSYAHAFGGVHAHPRGGDGEAGGGPRPAAARCAAARPATVPAATVRDADAFVARVVAAVARTPAAGDHSLCRGEAGVLDFLQTAAAGEPALLHRRAGALLAALDRFGPRCGTPDAVSSPGLLTGLAGIGHGLLRLGFDTRVPSVLLLRSPGRRSTPASAGQLTRSREGDTR